MTKTKSKSPEDIAQDAMEAFTFVSAEPDDDNNDVEEVDYYFIRDQITAAIEADRAQRDIYELIAEALHDRAFNWEDIGDPEGVAIAARQRRAAEYLRNQEADDGWDRFIGPMLDAMEQEYGR